MTCDATKGSPTFATRVFDRGQVTRYREGVTEVLNPGVREEYVACTHCGSMHPDAFMDYVRSGAKIGPTDKNYKAYVDVAPGPMGKFYYEHLTTEQRLEFVDLANAGKINIDYPGRFYVRPFFMVPVKP